jgi:hypothetical protein
VSAATVYSHHKLDVFHGSFPFLRVLDAISFESELSSQIRKEKIGSAFAGPEALNTDARLVREDCQLTLTLGCNQFTLCGKSFNHQGHEGSLRKPVAKTFVDLSWSRFFVYSATLISIESALYIDLAKNAFEDKCS